MRDTHSRTLASVLSLVLGAMLAIPAFASNGYDECSQIRPSRLTSANSLVGVDNKVATCSGVSATRMTARAGEPVELMANATHPAGKTLKYRWVTTGGRIVGEGAKVRFETAGLSPGKYTVTAYVSDNFNPEIDCSVVITVIEPGDSTAPPN